MNADKSNFQASLAEGKILSQSSFFGTLEIMAKILSFYFVAKNSNEFISSKHRIFRDIRTAYLLRLNHDSGSFDSITFNQIANHFDKCRKLEKIYSNQCLKTILPIVGEKAISVIGYNKESGEIVFLSFFEKTRRVVVILSGYENTPDLLKLAHSPEIILYDDYSSQYELEFLMEESNGLDKIHSFIEEDNLSRVFSTAFRSLGKQFYNINSEHQFLDFQYTIYFWLYENLEKKIIGSSLEAHLNTWDLALDSSSADAIKFVTKRTRLILDALKNNYSLGINKMCMDYLYQGLPQKSLKYKSRKPKNAHEMLTATVEQFYDYIKSVANDSDTLNAMLDRIGKAHLETLEDDVSLLQLYSQIYVFLKYTLNKSKKYFSYNYALCTVCNTSFLSKCIGSKIKKNMGIGFNQPTTKYAQKAGPREIFWTGRGVE